MYAREIEITSGESGASSWVGLDGVEHAIAGGAVGRKLSMTVNRRVFPADIHVGDLVRVPIDRQTPDASSPQFRVTRVAAREQTLELNPGGNLRFWRVAIDGEEVGSGSPSGGFRTTRVKRWLLPGRLDEDVRGRGVLLRPQGGPAKKWQLSISFYKDTNVLPYYPGEAFEGGTVASCGAERVAVGAATIWKIDMEVVGEEG